MSESTISGTAVEFSAGDVIFNEGDPGGDLFLIKEGEVEVFRVVDGIDVRLAVLKKNEILGVMTCMTRDPRLASARALTDLKALIVKQAGFSRLVESTPMWVRIVIKDFILRIKHLDEMYGKLASHFKISQKRTGKVALVSNVAAALRSMVTLNPTPGESIDVKYASDFIGFVLHIPSDVATAILKIFMDTKLVVGSDSSIQVNSTSRLVHFTNFCRSFISAKSIQVSDIELDDNDINMLLRVVSQAEIQRLDLNNEVRMKTAKIKEEISKLSKDAWNRSTLDRAQKLKLLSIDKGDEESIRLIPVEVEIKVKAIRIWRLLDDVSALDYLEAGPAPIDALKDSSEVQVITENF